MAQIRRSISWAAYPFVVLTSFLFSMIHLAPPAWTKTHGATDVPLGGFSGPELTGLIGELCENELFDHRLSEEHRRLQSGTLDLAQVAPETKLNTPGMTALPPAPYLGPAAPETMELAPLDELAPPSDVLLQQTPGATAQPQPSTKVQPNKVLLKK